MMFDSAYLAHSVVGVLLVKLLQEWFSCHFNGVVCL